MRKPRIIIFDDDTLLLEMLRDYFYMLNCEVQSFNKPLLCSSQGCSSSCADIIVTDFQMPDINGAELLGRQIKRGCPINIKNKAIMSGALPEKYAGNIHELAGVFFQKPISFKKLSEWIRDRISLSDLCQPLGSYFVSENHHKETFQEAVLRG